MNKLVYILWIIGGALLVIFVQLKFSVVFPLVSHSFARALDYHGSAVILGFWVGLLFGLISCPICGVPLVSYTLGAEEGKAKAIVFASILFNVSRFIVFFILGILAGVVGEAIIQSKLNTLLPFVTVAVGIFLVILSLDLFNILNLRAYLTSRIIKLINPRINTPKLNIQHPVEYVIWGMILGVVCVMEGLAFVTPVWLDAIRTANIFYGILAMLAFTIGAFIPPVSMLAICGGGVELLSKRVNRLNLLRTIRYIGGFVLLFLGTQYMVLGITSAQSILMMNR